MPKPLDDSQLLRLASDPRTRLFPTLRDTSAIGPLVILAGLLPCLAGVLGAELGDRAAAWSLRSLDLVSAAHLQEWLEPGRDGLGRGYVHQPPLSTWLRALAVPPLGTDRLASWRAVSLALVSLSIWAMYLLGRQLGGPAFGLMAVVAICGHPVVLRLASGTSPAALGMLLVVVTIWGYLGHLEGPPQLVSLRMLAGSMAWGLALLAVGPVAVMLIFPLIVHAGLRRDNGGIDPSESAPPANVPGAETGRVAPGSPPVARDWPVWLGTRTLVVFIATALSFSAWWQLMMLSSYGADFWKCWWTGQVVMNLPASPPQSFWRDWLAQNTFLVGFLVVGLASALNELRKPASEVSRQRCQFVVAWWLTALAIRVVFDAPRLRQSALIDAWEVLLLVPTALLAAWGARAIILRWVPSWGEALLAAATAGLCLWRASNQAWIGLATFAVALAVVALLPIVTPRIRRGARRWAERDWRRLLRATFAVIIVGQLATGLTRFPQPSPDSRSLTDLRKRIAALSSVSRVTLMAMDDAIPESLLFVLRSRWPASQFVVATRATPPRRNAVSGSADELLIEWTNQDQRIANELPADRQATAVGDPLRFGGRRLMIYRIAPR